MEIQRQQEVVEAYHYDIRDPEKEYKPDLKVGFSPLKTEDPNYPEENTILGTRIEFILAFEHFVLSGRVSQVNHVVNRKIDSPQDLTQDEVDELVQPLFNIIQRLTFEVTEIATDQPGLNLNFKSETGEKKE